MSARSARRKISIGRKEYKMRGSIRIYVNRETKGIYLLKEYKTQVGFWRVMGNLVSVSRNTLKGAF